MVKILTVLEAQSFSQYFLLKKMQMQKLLTFFFSAKILAYMLYLMISSNDTLTNDSVSLEMLGPDHIVGHYENTPIEIY